MQVQIVCCCFFCFYVGITANVRSYSKCVTAKTSRSSHWLQAPCSSGRLKRFWTRIKLIYMILDPSHWFFQESVRLTVTEQDTEPHRCYGWRLCIVACTWEENDLDEYWRSPVCWPSLSNASQPPDSQRAREQVRRRKQSRINPPLPFRQKWTRPL